MGAMARVELIGKVGRNGSAEQQVFEVEIPRDELCGLGLASGQSVRLSAGSCTCSTAGRSAALVNFHSCASFARPCGATST